ncbi:MAG: NAD(P)/FAD-dependent oxidoreductase [Armatimonadetes bacterium]|nr:NAD(P)/FAD-dependent oxidoreductase [Armatimonadota bacterium]
MSSPLRRDLLAGAAAGLAGGLVFGWAMRAQAYMVTVAGLLGLQSAEAGLALHVLIATVVGAGFGAVFRYQPHSHAATISSGLMYGLLWWIVGPLTLTPLLAGQKPAWSLAETSAAFPTLIGHLLYGGVVGAAFYILVTFYLRAHPASAAPAIAGETPTRRVVILGGGFGGVSAAHRLEQLFARDLSVEITLVSQSNYLLFTPMLAEVASSGLEAQHISTPVRAALPRTRFRRAEAEAIDCDAREVRIRASASAPVETLPYDHLVLALGAVPNFYGLPGVEACCFTLKTLQDAIRLRNHVIVLLERADVEPDPGERRRQLTFVVTGGGFAGTEMVAEMFDLVHSVLRYYPHIEAGDLRFVLVHSGDRILPEISAELGAYARRKLEGRGIEFLLGRRVAAARPDAVALSDGTEVPARTLVWTAGNQPNPLLRTLPCERGRAGAVVVENTLQVRGLSNVWAVGDCAQIPDPDRQGSAYPPTAQHALREGIAVAENVAAALAGSAPRAFRFTTIGTLVALGHHTAVAEVRGWRFSGLLAWFMWRTVYLSKLPGLEKKVRVALDWTIDLFFPRDIVLTADAGAPLRAAAGGDAAGDETPRTPPAPAPQTRSAQAP